MGLRASPVDSPKFCIVWRVNSSFYLLAVYFFKYTFQQTLYLLSILFKYYFFILSLIFLYSPFNFHSFIPKNYIHNIFTTLSQKIICDKLILILI